jgi:hypothetical protein
MFLLFSWFTGPGVKFQNMQALIQKIYTGTETPQVGRRVDFISPKGLICKACKPKRYQPDLAVGFDLDGTY